LQAHSVSACIAGYSGYVNVEMIVCNASGYIIGESSSVNVGSDTVWANFTIVPYINATLGFVADGQHQYWFGLLGDNTFKLFTAPSYVYSGVGAFADSTNNYANPSNPTDASVNQNVASPYNIAFVLDDIAYDYVGSGGYQGVDRSNGGVTPTPTPAPAPSDILKTLGLNPTDLAIIIYVTCIVGLIYAFFCLHNTNIPFAVGLGLIVATILCNVINILGFYTYPIDALVIISIIGILVLGRH
jgi:hypothetical protein